MVNISLYTQEYTYARAGKGLAHPGILPDLGEVRGRKHGPKECSKEKAAGKCEGDLLKGRAK